ncbi:MAG: hypothetical protein WA719_04255, partial [Thermoplasmata archaeon]
GNLSPEAEARLRSYVDQRFREVSGLIPAPLDTKGMEVRLTGVTLDSEARSNSTLERRLREAAEQDSKRLAALREDLAARLAAVEARPVVPPSAISDEVSKQLGASLDPKLGELSERLRLAVRTSVDATALQLRGEIAESLGQIQAGAAKSEEELRAALVAQMDLELQEAKEQGSALREEIEGRVRDVLKDRLSELEQRRAREVRELEQRLGLLVEGRTKDLETRLTAAAVEQRERIVLGEQEQIAQVERRLGLASEARLARAVEAQTQSAAGLQVRLQSYFDQRLREDQEREREKYVELLARFKTEVDQAMAHSVESSVFDAAVRRRLTDALETRRVADQEFMDTRVAEVGAALAAQQEAGTARLAQVETQLQVRETAISEVEQRVRNDLEELDRRLSVMSDRMVPLVRDTWLKVDELQKGGGPSAAADARLREFRREYSRQLHRIEGELLEQTTELRDRMEGAIAHQGRIWLNFMRQMAASDDDVDAAPTDAAARSLRRASRAASATNATDARAGPLRSRPSYPPFEEDPVNPLDPEGDSGEPVEPEPLERRRTRRSS